MGFSKAYLSLAVLISTVSVAEAGNSLPPPAGYSERQKIFEDQFTDPVLNTNNWNPWLGQDNVGRWGDDGQLPSPYSGSNCNSTCSNSFQVQYDDPFSYGDSANVSGSHLIGGGGYLAEIAAPSTYFGDLGYSWAGAAVSSYSHAYLPATGGYVQWHAKMPDSRYGAWAGLWLLSTNGAEMDIQETGHILSGVDENNVLAMDWHGSGGSENHQDAGEDLSAAYHTYGVEYRPGQSWKVYLDGVLRATWTAGVPTHAQYQVLMDMEVAGPAATGWHTVADPVNYPGPFEFDIDDVQIYELPSWHRH